MTILPKGVIVTRVQRVMVYNDIGVSHMVTIRRSLGKFSYTGVGRTIEEAIEAALDASKCLDGESDD